MKIPEWGLIKFPRGKIIFKKICDDKIVLIEPNGGFFYPYKDSFEACDKPNTLRVASALAGISETVLLQVAEFCGEARTMSEIENAFPSVQAWRLRRL